MMMTLNTVVRAIPIRRHFHLAQAPAQPYHVVLTDPRGIPWEGVQVTVQGVTQVSDAEGVATFPSIPPGPVAASIKVGDFNLEGKGTSDKTLFVTVPLCAPGPFLTNTELIALVAGGAMSVAGYYWKQSLIGNIGGAIFGAGIFTLIYRQSCRW